MKKFFKNNLKLFVGIIIGGITFGSIGVYASSLLAKNISFTPKDNTWNVSNVEDAINSLYSSASNDCISFFSEAINTSSGGVFYRKEISVPINVKKVIIESYYGSTYGTDGLPKISGDSVINVESNKFYIKNVGGRFQIVGVRQIIDVDGINDTLTIEYSEEGGGGHFAIGHVTFE